MKNNAVLSVAGFDPTCCAGIVTDSITFRNIGIKHLNLITALTAQNSEGLSEIMITPERIFKKQFEKLLENYTPKVIKTGMLPAKYQIDLLASYINMSGALLIVDPVKSASSGGELISDEVYSHIIEKLFPISFIVTPNIPEAEYITGEKINNTDDMIEVVKLFKKTGSCSVYLKGGHLNGDPVDILSVNETIYEFKARRVKRKNLRGTGCKLASAIAAYVFLEKDIVKACKKAKNYIEKVIAEPGKYY